jgi:hypothetical protein
MKTRRWVAILVANTTNYIRDENACLFAVCESCDTIECVYDQALGSLGLGAEFADSWETEC